jgi:hypothetical protein
MKELSGRYNYPIFFEREFGGEVVFDSIENAVTVRHVVSEEKMGPKWTEELAGDPDKVAWLHKHLRGSQPG